MKEVVYLYPYKNVFKAVKKGFGVFYPRNEHTCYFLAQYLEKYRYKDDRLLEIYLVALALAYVRGKEHYEKVLPIIEQEMPKLSDDRRAIFEARLYRMGVIYEKNIDKCIEILEPLAEKGNIGAKIQLLSAFANSNKDYNEKNKRLILELVNDDEPIGFAYYGICLIEGNFFKKNESLGLEYLLKAYKAKDYTLCFYLGLYYRDKKDYKTALKYIKEGQKHDMMNCVSLLAEFYRDGKGVETDKDKAMELYSSASHDYPRSDLFRAELWLIGTPKHEKNPIKAFVLLERYRGEKEGYYYFLYARALLARNTEYKKAIEYLRKAVTFDDLEPKHIRMIGDIFKDDFKSETEAEKYYKLADETEVKIKYEEEN